MGAFDDLIPTDQTQSPLDQKQVANKSLARKQQNKSTSVGQDTGFDTGITSEIMSFLGDINKASQGVAVTGLQALQGRKQNVGQNIINSFGSLFGSELETPQELTGNEVSTPKFSDIFQREGVDPKTSEILGSLASTLTDPTTYIGAGGLAKASKAVSREALAETGNLLRTAAKEGTEIVSKEIAPQVAKETLEAADNKIAQAGFDLVPEKKFGDFQKQIQDKQNKLLTIDDNPMLDIKEKALAKSQIAQEMDDLKYEQVLNEMSDYANDITKRTIFTKKPNELTSLVQTYISNRGQFGNALYRQAERASDTLDALRGKWMTQFESRGNLPKVFGNLTKDQRSNYFAAMEGFEDVSDPVVKQLVDISRKNRAEIAENAIKRGVQVKNANSSTSKFFSIKENHMPHYVIDPKQVVDNSDIVKESLEYSVRTGRFKDINEANKIYHAYANAIKNNIDGIDLRVTEENKPFFDWLVKNKQADDIPDAIRRFQDTNKEVKTAKSGSLETQRIIDIPFYDTNPERVLTRYYSSVAKRFGEIDNFGRDNEIANQLIEGIRKEFGDKDANRVSNMINLMTGANKPSDIGVTLAQGLRDIESARKLDLAVFLNMTQSANTGSVIGIQNLNKALIDNFTKEGRDYAYKAGVLFSETARSMYNVSDDLITGKIANSIMQMTGFNEVEKFNRVLAALGGKHFANEQAMKFIASNGTNKSAERALRNMGLHPDIILKRGSLTEDDMLTASRYITNRTQFRSRILDSPEWASSPWGKLVNQFKNYGENQVKFLREELINEARQGNYAPIVRFAVLAPPSYAGAKALKDVVKGKDQRLDTRTNWQKAAEIAANMGVLGMYYDVLMSMNFKGQGWVSGLIPAMDTIGQGGSAVFEVARPVMSKWLGKNEAKLLNLKPLTRFGTSFAPVVKTRLLDALKEPADKQREAARTLTEATQRGQDLGPILEALREDKRVNVSKALKSAKSSQKSNTTKMRKANTALNESSDVKRALMQLGLVSIPTSKRSK